MKTRHHGLFHRLFLLITTLVLTLALLMLLTGGAALQIYVRNSAVDAAEERLAQKKYILEYTLNTIERTVYALASDNYCLRYVLLPGNVNERYPVWKGIVDKINDVMTAFEMIDSVYLYAFDKDKEILFNGGVLSRSDFYDRAFVNHLTHQDYNHWQAARLPSSTLLSITGDVPRVMSYIQPVPAQASAPQGIMVINVRVDSLNRIMKPSSEKERIILMNGEGVMMVDSDGIGAGKSHAGFESAVGLGDNDLHETELDGIRNLIIKRPSKFSDWNYYYFITDPYAESWHLFIRGLMFILFVFLGLGTLAAWFIARRYTRPWECLIDEVLPVSGKDEMASFSGTVLRLKAENEKFHEEEVRSEQGFLPENSSRSVVMLENMLETWRNGISVLESDGFYGKTDKLLEMIAREECRDNYKTLILQEMVRSMIVCVWGRGGSTRDLFRDDCHIIKNMHQKNDLNERLQYVKEISMVCKQFIEKTRPHPREELVDKLMTYLVAHYREELYTDAIAAYLNLSEAYFCRVVKEVTGKTFTELLREIRFREVCRLLVETDENLDQIAELTGLKSRRNLVRVFHKYRDDTPGRYRQKKRLEQKLTP